MTFSTSRSRMLLGAVVLGLVLPMARGHAAQATTPRPAAAAAGDAETDPAHLAAAMERAGERRTEWVQARRECPAELRGSLEYLLASMPAQDLQSLSVERVMEEVQLAHEAWTTAPWGASVPRALFLDAILPYASVSEARDPWRRDFRERFLPLVADCKTPGEAAQVLNAKVFGILGVRYSTERERADQSPRESIEQGLASCTGLSIVLVDACRAVGVPARLAGIASWVNKNGNHTWVEVWDREWHFTGAAEPSGAGLNHTWFQGDAALAQPGSTRHGIWAVSWRPTPTPFPMVWTRDGPRVFGVEVTSRYLPQKAVAADRCRLMVEVRDAAGRRQAVDVQLREAGEGTRSWVGRSRGESADTNDLLTFEVPRGANYVVEVIGAEPEAVEIGAEEDQKVVTVVRSTPVP